MEKFTDEASRIVLDRFKNPYISTFLISWILFNWRPISFFIFSAGNIEYKINFINKHYSDSLHFFIYPLCSTLIYLFALPYLNMINEWCVRLSIKKRADYVAEQVIEKISRDTEIAEKEVNKEAKIAKARSAESDNKTLAELNETLAILQKNLNDERVEKQEVIRKFEDDLKQINSVNDRKIQNLSLDVKNKEDIIEVLNSNLKVAEERYDEQIKQLNKELLKSKFFYERFKNKEVKLIKLSNNRRLFETFNEAENPNYYDIDRGVKINAEEFYQSLKNNAFVEIEDENNREFKNAFEIYQQIPPF